MKKQIMLTGLMCIAIAGSSLAQHDHSGHVKKNETPMKMDMDKPMEMINKYDVGEEFQSQLNAVVDANQQLVEVFRNDDQAGVKSAIEAFPAQLDKVNMSLLEGDAHHAWMGYAKDLKNETKEIMESTDIAKQRVHFEKLDNALYKSLKAFGTGGEKVYYNHCTMANNNAGANWLTTTSEIQNPYLGQKMPKCGSTKEVLN